MVTSSFVAMAKLWCLAINLVKSKGIVVGTGADAHGLSPVPAGGDFIDLMEDFQYLGSYISRDGKLSREVSEHLAKASRMLVAYALPYFLIKACPLTLKGMFTLLLFYPLCCVWLRLWLLN